ncbi:hypothetical protein CMO96_03880 [Candidatus Woesebacteria bacterium]|nr:hypothetical protein [Candidatus Woesebacteria bacterium]|tara:strand:+ start:175 stop:459 length:285 start_codon:yes stop_codon:yes gene_type:complete
MLIEIKEGKKIISSREVELKELGLTDHGKFLDLLHDFYQNPKDNLFSRAINMCRLMTDYTDEELRGWSEAEYLQLFRAVIDEKNAEDKKKSNSV